MLLNFLTIVLQEKNQNDILASFESSLIFNFSKVFLLPLDICLDTFCSVQSINEYLQNTNIIFVCVYNHGGHHRWKLSVLVYHVSNLFCHIYFKSVFQSRLERHYCNSNLTRANFVRSDITALNWLEVSVKLEHTQ